MKPKSGRPDTGVIRRRALRECSKCCGIRVAQDDFTGYTCKRCQLYNDHPNSAVPDYCLACSYETDTCRRCGEKMD